MTKETTFRPEDVLSLWFPDNGHWNSPETHGAFWTERMQGGMDERIIADYALDHPQIRDRHTLGLQHVGQLPLAVGIARFALADDHELPI